MMLEEDRLVGERVSLKPTRFTNVIKTLKKVFNSRIFPYMILTFLISSITVFGGNPFAYIMLGIATTFSIPLLFPLIATVLSFTIFKQAIDVYVLYFITYFIYLISTIFITVDNTSKKYTSLIRVVAVFLATSIVLMLFNKTSISALNTLKIIVNSLAIISMYPVFASGNAMLYTLRKNIIFSREEIISFGVVMTVVLTILSKLTILSFSVSNVLILVLIIMLSWKNDWIVGSACGVVMGLVYSIITGDTTLVITTCGFTGLISGLLSKFGKLPVIATFLIGNIALSYLYTNDLNLWYKAAEFLIASGVIIALPKKAILKLEKLFNASGALPAGYENQLGPAVELKSRIGAIGEVFDNLAHITTPVDEETMNETLDVISKYLQDRKKNECIACKKKYECLNDEDIALISQNIAKRLEENKPIYKEMLPIECNMSDEIVSEIIEIYNNIKLMRIIKQKENEMNVKMAEEYQVVSKLLKKMSNQRQPNLSQVASSKQIKIREEIKYLGYSIYEDTYLEDERDITYEFITDILTDIEKAKKDIERVVSRIVGVKMSIKLILNSSKTEKSRIKLIPSSKYIINAVVKQIKKADSEINGDSYIVTELKDNNKIIAISDGMGSGQKSKDTSLSVINMIESLSKTGIGNQEILNIINKFLKCKENGAMTATLDLCILNEKKDSLDFIKIGAAPSFVIENGIVVEMKCTADSMGVNTNIIYDEYQYRVKRNTYLVMLSDGVLGKVTLKKVQSIIDKLSDKLNEASLMDNIMEEVISNQNQIVLDDITIIVAKIS